MDRHAHNGFGLVEIMVALVVIAVGLLGLAGLQTKAQQAELEAYQRTQALLLLQDMVDRLNANRPAAGCYAITQAASGSPFAGTGNTATFACSAYGTTASRYVADADLSAWDSALKGAAERGIGGTNVGAMAGARGCVTYNAATDVYTVSVAWQGLTDTITPTDTCGTGQYGDETKRRVLSQTLVLAELS